MAATPPPQHSAVPQAHTTQGASHSPCAIVFPERSGPPARRATEWRVRGGGASLRRGCCPGEDVGVRLPARPQHPGSPSQPHHHQCTWLGGDTSQRTSPFSTKLAKESHPRSWGTCGPRNEGEHSNWAAGPRTCHQDAGAHRVSVPVCPSPWDTAPRASRLTSERPVPHGPEAASAASRHRQAQRSARGAVRTMSVCPPPAGPQSRLQVRHPPPVRCSQARRGRLRPHNRSPTQTDPLASGPGLLSVRPSVRPTDPALGRRRSCVTHNSPRAAGRLILTLVTEGHEP